MKEEVSLNQMRDIGRGSLVTQLYPTESALTPAKY